jgi:tRNA dimethylallyltransferase
MGPTASGKTRLAIALTQHFPCDIISVDSAMVYRGMDIGTAKPTREEQALAPHRLLDILDPSQPYSAGQFCLDAQQAITEIIAKGRTPLLVGGTMLYFRALQQGLSPLPPANPELRQRLLEQANVQGWEALHQRLGAIDPVAAQRISPHDQQRIQRALEIYELTGRPMTTFCQDSPLQPTPYPIINLALIPKDRTQLHQRIAERFTDMLAQGFIEEVQSLRQRGDLNPDLPSLRAVGYRQVWRYLEGLTNAADMQEQALAATRQLAKRQLTWLRSWPELLTFDADIPQAELLQQVLETIK